MDPLGNLPIFMSVLKHLEPRRRRVVLIRELLIALLLMLIFLFAGEKILAFLNLRTETVSISGGIILFLIAIKMIFPSQEGNSSGLSAGEEPFLVPLAIPLVAGPSILAALMLLSHQYPHQLPHLVAALLIAWGLSAAILLMSNLFLRLLGSKGVGALERLMGLILVMLSTQMFLDGVRAYMKQAPDGADDGPRLAGGDTVDAGERVGDHAVQRLVDVDRLHIRLLLARLFQRGELRNQHLRFEEVAFALFQALLNHRLVAFQVEKMQVAIAFAQAVTIAFQRRTHQQRHRIGALHGEDGVVERSQPRSAIVVVQRMPGGHFVDVGARVQVIAVQHGGIGFPGDGAGHGGFTAAGHPHQDKYVILRITHCVMPLWELARARQMRPN